MLISIVLLLIFNSLSLPCSLASPGNLASTITACLRTIPKNNTELEIFVGTVIEYVKNSPYPLLFLSGPNGLTPFDTLSKLEALKTEATNWDKTVLEFYEKIHDIIGELKDPHATLVFPFLRYFVYFLPYGFAPVTNNENSFRLVPNMLTPLYLSSAEADDYTNYIVESMDLKGGGSSYKPATEAFSEFALDVGNAGHDPHALFNSVLKKGNVFGALEVFRPEERYNNNVFLKGKDTNGNDVDISIPWLGLYNHANPNIDSLDDLSPLVIETTLGRSRNSGEHINRNRNSSKHFLPHMLRNQIPPILVERQRMVKEIKQRFGVDSDFTAKASSEHHQSRLISSTYEKILAVRQSSHSHSMGDSPPSTPINLVQIYPPLDAQDDMECTIYVDEANKLGYIRYTSFMQDSDNVNGPVDFLDQFGKKYKEMVSKGVTDVIFDVRGNGGGMTLLVEEFTDFFFHNTVYPADLDTDVLLGSGSGAPTTGGNYLTILFTQIVNPRPDAFYKIENGVKQPIEDVLNPPVTKTHSNATGSGSPSPFTASYTQRGFYNMRLNTSISQAYGGYSPFDPQHFYIVTDGDCASCCGIFTKLAIESKAARVLGYGVNPKFKDDISTYVPGNCAGSLYGSTEVETMRTNLENLADTVTPEDLAEIGIPSFEVLLAMLPPKFQRENVSFGVTDFEFFSRNPSHLDQTLYMVPAHVADVLPFQVSSEMDTIEDLKEIATTIKNLYIDDPAACVVGEVIPDDSCQTDERTAAHQVWGKTCSGDCAFAHCQREYYLSGETATTCSAFPADPPPPPQPNPGPGGAGAVVSVPVLLVAFLFAVLMLW